MVKKYIIAFILSLFVILLLSAGAWNLEQNRLNQMNSNLNDLVIKSEDTKLMFLYLETSKEEEKEKFCDLLDVAIKKQMDKGYEIVKKMKQYEEASLIANYEMTRKRYILNNIELFIYNELEMKYCPKKTDIILFFYDAKTNCPECSVQGEVLDKIREQCSNVRVYSISRDEDLGMVKMLNKKFNITKSPTIVINNKPIYHLAGEQEILKYINCSKEIR